MEGPAAETSCRCGGVKMGWSVGPVLKNEVIAGNTRQSHVNKFENFLKVFRSEAPFLHNF